MSIKRRVLPAHVGAIGTVHPLDGALTAEGSDWTMDTFTQRRLHDGEIAFHQKPMLTKPEPTVSAAPVEITKGSARVTTQKQKIETR